MEIIKFIKKHKTELLIPIITILYISFIGQGLRIDGISMEPTLKDGQYHYVNKLTRLTKDYERYDIIVFHPNGSISNIYIKRIIGLPGETVEIDKDGNIFINEKPLIEPVHYEQMIKKVNIKMTLGEDEYFVLGDNRNHTADSRYKEIGPVKIKDIIGRVVVWKKN